MQDISLFHEWFYSIKLVLETDHWGMEGGTQHQQKHDAFMCGQPICHHKRSRSEALNTQPRKKQTISITLQGHCFYCSLEWPFQILARLL